MSRKEGNAPTGGFTYGRESHCICCIGSVEAQTTGEQSNSGAVTVRGETSKERNVPPVPGGERGGHGEGTMKSRSFCLSRHKCEEASPPLFSSSSLMWEQS